MFCDPGALLSGLHMGGWLLPGSFMVLVSGLVFWLIFRRRPSGPAAALSCPNCTGAIQESYMRCPHCGDVLKHNCANCSRVVEQEWSYCPFCHERQSAAAVSKG